MKKLFPILFSFVLVACSNMTVTLTEYPEAERVGEVTVTLLPTFTSTSVPTLTPSPAPAETGTPAPTFEWKQLPDTPAELQANAITADELIVMAGSEKTEVINAWLNAQAAKAMKEINANWTGPRANGLVTLGFPEQGNYTALGLSLDKKVSTREQVPIQVLGVQMIEGDEPNVFFPAEWGKAEGFLKEEYKPVLIQLGILTNVIGEDGKPMTLTVTGLTTHKAILDSKNKVENWGEWQNCLTKEGDEAITIGFTFGSAGGDGLSSGFMKGLSVNFDPKGTFLGENSVGKRWMEAGNTGVSSDPHFRPLKTPEDVAFWQKVFDTKGPFPMFRVTPGVFNEYKAK